MPSICEVCGVPYPESSPAREGERRLCPQCREASPESVFVSASEPAEAPPSAEKAPRIALLPGFEKACRRSYAAGGWGMLWMALAAGLSAAIFSSVYAGFQFYRPVLLAVLQALPFLGRLADPLNFIPIGACALAQGWLIGKAGILGGTRHNGALIAFGFLGGMLTLYWSWALYLRLLGGGAWVLSPFELLGGVNALAAAHPPWSTGLISLESGYKVVWALEAMAIAGGAASERSGGSIGAETPLIEGLTLDGEAYEWLLKRLSALRSG